MRLWVRFLGVGRFLGFGMSACSGVGVHPPHVAGTMWRGVGCHYSLQGCCQVQSIKAAAPRGVLFTPLQAEVLISETPGGAGRPWLFSTAPCRGLLSQKKAALRPSGRNFYQSTWCRPHWQHCACAGSGIMPQKLRRSF